MQQQTTQVSNEWDADTRDSEALTVRNNEAIAVATPSTALAIPDPSADIQWWSESLQTVLDRPPSALPFRLIAGGVAFFCIFGIWAGFGRIEEVGQAQGTLVPEGEVFKVQPAEAGTVVNIAVEEGEEVDRGQLIAELDSLVATTEVERLEEMLASYRQQFGQNQIAMAELARDTQSRLAIANATLEAQQVVIAQNQRDIAAKQELLSLLDIEIVAHTDRLENLRPYAEDGVISREYLFNAEQSLRDRMSAIAQARGDRDRVIAETLKLRAELEQRQAEVYRTESEARQRLQELEMKETQLQADIDETEKQLEAAQAKLDRLFLYAPVDGVVSSLNIRNTGEVTQQGDTIAEIAPEDAPLVLLAALPDREAGFIEVGMLAQVKLDAFPYQDFGIIKGTVNSISPDAEANEQMGAVYQVEISLERTYISSDGRDIELKAGQTGQAEIVIRQQRIIDVLLDPIQRLRGDGLSL
ncbi:HlyD family type I secretion periplasmic adaptor subunit [Synechococcus sp. PCC 7336]|uniref:HlyD family type I secretion periplasmic adaptor subunit n=1 Tax=Synechococcus sp. PCC 7336 TaxID=195250 RepID=UPI000347C97A|nr:HlyD family type I secretion periplasmic adaptor subunit [Synechococcus sp. PCC 7336]